MRPLDTHPDAYKLQLALYRAMSLESWLDVLAAREFWELVQQS